MAAYHRVYDSHHLQADCQESGSAPEPYARLSSMGYLLPKIKTLSSRTLSQTPDLENFATASRSRCQQNSSLTVELIDDTYTTIDES